MGGNRGTWRKHGGRSPSEHLSHITGLKPTFSTSCLDESIKILSEVSSKALKKAPACPQFLPPSTFKRSPTNSSCSPPNILWTSPATDIRTGWTLKFPRTKKNPSLVSPLVDFRAPNNLKLVQWSGHARQRPTGPGAGPKTGSWYPLMHSVTSDLSSAPSSNINSIKIGSTFVTGAISSPPSYSRP